MLLFNSFNNSELVFVTVAVIIIIVSPWSCLAVFSLRGPQQV